MPACAGMTALRDVIPAEAGIQMSFETWIFNLLFEAGCDSQRYTNLIPLQGVNQYRPPLGSDCLY